MASNVSRQTGGSQSSFARPDRTYVICSSPRTGSSLLASALTATRRAGQPAEYFDIHPHNEDVWRRRLGISDEAEYLRRVISHATTENRVCGLKLHWHQTECLRQRLRHELYGDATSANDIALAELMPAIFGQVRHIWIRRGNKIAQGISYLLAARTGIWRLAAAVPGQPVTPIAPEFDVEEIHRYVERCDEFDRGWETYFRDNGIAPLIVVYEEFVRSYVTTVTGVLRFIGVPGADAITIPRPEYRRQAGALSEDWERLYRAARRPLPVLSPRPAASTTPRSDAAAEAAACSYLICANPRSGGTLLTDALTSTGIAGRPDEYFATAPTERDEWRWRRTDAAGARSPIEDIVARGSTPNGVFGARLSWRHRDSLRRLLLAHLEPDGGPDRGDTLEELIRRGFAAPRYVWLRRRNEVAQAISHYRAERTGVWRAIAGRGDQRTVIDQSLSYDFDEIDRLVNRVNEQDWRWGNHFTRHRLTPLMIFYEDLVTHRDTVVRGILKFLGLPYEAVTIGPPILERQADERSREWEQRYRETRARRDAGGGSTTAASPTTIKPAAGEIVPAGTGPATNEATGAGTAPHEPALPIVAYRTSPGAGVPLVTAPARRAWMDQTPARFAYRCLPMLIANQSGWFILNPTRFTAIWNGDAGLDGVRIASDAAAPPRYAASHFGVGILTFTIPFLFRTSTGFNLLVRGPANLPKDAIWPLEGVVETDWADATFTMNWKFTRPDQPVTFEADEPIAMITPMRRGDLERFAPRIEDITADPELARGYQQWSRSRSAFNAELKVERSDARRQGWQRHYMRGQTVVDTVSEEHQTGLKLKPFH